VPQALSARTLTQVSAIEAARAMRDIRASLGHVRLPGVASCAQCGRTILLGEKSVRLRIDRQPVTICSLCAAGKAEAYRRAA
jgi:hypothetical protein